MASNNYLTVDDIRLYILDRSVADNDLDRDLSFSNDEIFAAMERAAREYNSLPPFVNSARAACLPKDTNMFLDGVVQQLYIAWLNRAMRNDIDYDAGGVVTSLEAKRIKHMQQLAQDHGERFREAARNRKVFLNMSEGYGPIG